MVNVKFKEVSQFVILESWSDFEINAETKEKLYQYFIRIIIQVAIFWSHITHQTSNVHVFQVAIFFWSVHVAALLLTSVLLAYHVR